jgi:membrane protein required for colicin V production
VNLLDLAVLVVIALSAIFAFARGFVREALSIAAWVGAALITLYGFDYALRMIERFVTTPLLAELIAGAALFLGSLILLTALTSYIANFLQWNALTPIDRTLGLAFGVARGLVLVSVAYFVVDITLPTNDRPDWLRDAKSQPFLEEGAMVVKGVLPEAWQVKSAAAGDEAQRAIGQAKAARDAMDALSNPAAAPVSPKGQDTPAPAYKPSDQRELDRLINNAH